MQHLVLYTVCSYCNIHEFTCTSWIRACIPVASVSPIDVPPIQRVLSIVVRTYTYIYIYIHTHTHTHTHTHVIQNNLRTPQLAGFARQLGCKKRKLNPTKITRYTVLQAILGIFKLKNLLIILNNCTAHTCS